MAERNISADIGVRAGLHISAGSFESYQHGTAQVAASAALVTHYNYFVSFRLLYEIIRNVKSKYETIRIATLQYETIRIITLQYETIRKNMRKKYEMRCISWFLAL